MNQKITQMIIQTIIMMIETQYYKYARLGVELEVTTTTTMIVTMAVVVVTITTIAENSLKGIIMSHSLSNRDDRVGNVFAESP